MSMATSQFNRSGRAWFRKDLGPADLLRLVRDGRAGVVPISLSLRQALRLWLCSLGVMRPADSRAVELPGKYPFAIPVHGGLKYFDPKSRRVTKVFDDGVSQSDRDRELEQVKRSSRVPCAPRLCGHLENDGGYTEELFSGLALVHQAKKDASLYSRIIPQVIDIIIETWAKTGVRQQSVDDLTRGSLRAIHDARSAANQAVPGAGDAMCEFASEIDNALRKEGGRVLWQCFSHGDFSLLNILRDGESIRVIDWETAGDFSALNDLYNYLTVELYYGRARAELAEVTSGALALIDERVRAIDEIGAEGLAEAAGLYRKVYYIERLGILCTRGVTPSVAKVIRRSVDIFRSFEGLFDTDRHRTIGGD